MTDDDHDGVDGESLVAAIAARLDAGKPIRRTLAVSGRLHVDRPLPFLCVYRTPDRPDPGTADLVRTQASYLIAPAGHDVSELVAAVVTKLASACGACLVVELWSGEPTAPPCFRIRTATANRLATTIDALADALRKMSIPGTAPTVEVIAAASASPSGAPPLLAPELAAHAGILAIGLEVPPIYRSARSVYPAISRTFSRELMHALQRAFFEFTRVQTPAKPEHFQVLGRRRIVHAVRESDAALAEISASFDFLLAVSPVNTDAAWQEFCANGRTRAPTLHYRMLELDPELGKRQLYALPLERLEDPVLAQLLRDKRRELDRQLGLLEDRDTPRFLLGSLQLYGGVDDALLGEALSILRDVAPARSRTGARCDAEAFAARATEELEHYRRHDPSLTSTVIVRDDISSLIVSHGDLLIPANLDVPAHRVDALLHHELGTHVVTYANGRAQPLLVLAAGLARYEALQEGLATFAEYVAGGLDSDRLRLVAARAVAVRRLVDEVAFPEVVAELVDQHRLAPRMAFLVAVRVFRGGGLTKDVIYLRGLLQLLGYLQAGHDLAPLLVGKLALDQVALIEELLRREVLRPPLLRPRWLDAPTGRPRLERAIAGLRPIDLLEPTGTAA
ncbi:MAG: DUF1704 domain-containing protein [Deltaproteobacteria bacterium]|nr:DUF1704 domain-containing protein [Deltaproteobacteria bacterium]MDQ3297927.1 DUF1704 domain-containing protein [Myxococcota bacterium]